MADLSDLFARLRGSEAPASPQPTGTSNYQQPSVSSPILSPPPNGPQPRDPSNIMSFNTTPTPNQPSDRSANLLNLLKFNQSPAQATSSSQTHHSRPPSGPVSASDLVASFGRQPAQAADVHARHLSSPLPAPQPSSTSSSNPQDMLLNLLKRSESSATNPPPISTSDLNSARAEREPTPVRVFGANDQPATSPFEAPKSASKGTIFTYVNPFEQLSGTPSRNQSPKPRAQVRTSVPSAAVLHQSSPSQRALPDGRSQLEALMGIGAVREPTETVADAMNDVAEQASKEVEQALANAEAGKHSSAEPHPQHDRTAYQQEIKDAVQEAATEIQHTLKDGRTRSQLEESVPKSFTKALKETVDAVAQDGVADSWESVDADEAANEVRSYTPKVYNLPMRPFVSLDVKPSSSPATKIRPDVVMGIASLKKSFDQVDRTLASASPNHIIYAMTKSGGFRIIRQDDGKNRSVFRHVNNQIFNVAISPPSKTSSMPDTETALATGTNGSVYWTSIPVHEDGLEAQEDLDKRGFIFPPLPSPEENTSTSQLKTRAKKSSRHPDFFAVGRGKKIHIIWPAVASSAQYMNEKTRIVDSVKYLEHRRLEISTGKAGKDFAFSEDDSLIVSLDKHGRLKFWDISLHVESSNMFHPERRLAVESKTPLLTLWVASNLQKAWPTSVQFVDKDRPTTKGIALRYMLVGLKQNHTIQLWDLGLGKAVQELNLPHENDTDAICSIVYHTKSGIVAVGHPTRNSIYLIHLSAPKYNLPSMTQAQFLHGLATKSPDLPRPESTAILSGIREISLSSLGHLRSIDILGPTPIPGHKDDAGDETVFEVYVMHSNGVTCLNLKRQDFGWGPDGKVMSPLIAEDEKVIEVSELRPPVSGEETAGDDQKTKTEATLDTTPKPSAKAEGKRVADRGKLEVPQASPAHAIVNGDDKAEKKKKKRSVEPDELVQRLSEVPAAAAAASYAGAAQRASAPELSTAVVGSAPEVSRAREISRKPLPDPPQAGESQAFLKLLVEQMDVLHRRIDEDKRVLEATAAARQDAVLRLVSSTLSENVEKSLHRIIAASIAEQVLPTLANTTASTIEQKVTSTLNQQMSSTLPREIKAMLPSAMSKALQEPEVLRIVSDSIASRLGPSVEKQFLALLQKNIAPAFRDQAVEAARKAASEVEQRVLAQTQHTQAQTSRDNAKIDQLTRLTSELSSTLTSMVTAQTELQQEVIRLRRELQQQREAGAIAPAPAANTSAAREPPRDPELESIAALMSAGRLEEGTIKWLQSSRQAELFDLLFVRYDPSYLRSLSQIVTLSVAAAVSISLGTKLEERLSWLEVVLGSTDAQSREIAEYAPRMMDVLVERLAREFMGISEKEPGSLLLGRIHGLVRLAKEIKGAAG